VYITEPLLALMFWYFDPPTSVKVVLTI
jgi:hypothetical protein